MSGYILLGPQPRVSVSALTTTAEWGLYRDGLIVRDFGGSAGLAGESSKPISFGTGQMVSGRPLLLE